jgi:periplasmic protein TonB
MWILKAEQRPLGSTFLLRLGAVLALAMVLAACGKDEPDPAATTAGAPAGQAEAPPPQAVSDAVAAMSPEELSEAASTALREQRLYAPAGDNAMEFYLALRDKQPQDPAVASALTDLMPYTLIATEQAIGRGDFAEAQRLYALMEKTDGNAPALPRLEQSIASAQEAAARQAEQATARTEQEAQRQQEQAAQREREQQQAQQQAAQQLAAQQAAARQAEEQRQAEQRAAAQQAAQQQPATPPAATPQPPQTTPARPAGNTRLIAVSTPAPSYPPDAFRSRQSGEVQVEFTVGTDGSVTSARVVRSNPRRVFDRAALDAVNRWRFQPVVEPITSRRTIEFAP